MVVVVIAVLLGLAVNWNSDAGKKRMASIATKMGQYERTFFWGRALEVSKSGNVFGVGFSNYTRRCKRQQITFKQILTQRF